MATRKISQAGDSVAPVGDDRILTQRETSNPVTTWTKVYTWITTLFDSVYLKLDQTSQQTTTGASKWDALDLNTAGAMASLEGRIKWNADDGTVEVGMPGGNVNLQIGQETIIRCKNITGSTITNGSVVYISGASGQRPEIALADADSITTSYVLGVATEDINTFGYVTLTGLTRDVNTNGMTEGLPIWLSQSAGEFTTTRPTAPAMSVFVGYVIYAHATEGVIAVRPVLVPRMSGLSDTYGTPSVNGQVYNWQTNRFELAPLHQITRGSYYYHAQSFTADTAGDWRTYSDATGFYTQYCTVGHATKGSGTWITKHTIQV